MTKPKFYVTLSAFQFYYHLMFIIVTITIIAFSVIICLHRFSDDIRTWTMCSMFSPYIVN